MGKQCPHCKKEIDGNHASYANHVRWCKDNPNRESMLEHMSNALRNHEHNLRFKRDKFKVKCSTCGKEFEVEERVDKFPSKEKYYCCRSCANTRMHTIEIKQKIKDSVDRYWESIGKSSLKTHVCEECGKEFQTRKYTSKFCSKECMRKYLRRTSCRTSTRSKLEQYREACSFKFALSDFPEEFDFSLIEEHGWYKPKNHGDNLYGVSRDHMVSVLYGFEHNIDPSIISHPANCQLLVHSDNVRKKDRCSITYEELLERIEKWEEKYGPYRVE